MGPLPGNPYERRDGEEDTRPGSKHEKDAPPRQHNARLVIMNQVGLYDICTLFGYMEYDFDDN